jgi:hypothetical protein
MARYAGSGKNTVEGCRSIDVLEWHRRGYLRTPRWFSWTWTRDGEGVASINVETQRHYVPDHPGVIHYLLHAYDNTPYASRGLTAALRLAKVAPSSPHALQFPAHIFNRMGLWQESIATNQAGAAVDDLFFKPHAMDFLVHSYLQTGQAGT